MDISIALVVLWIIMLVLGAKKKKKKGGLFKSLDSFDKGFSAKDFFAKNFPQKPPSNKSLPSQKLYRTEDKSTDEPSESSPGIKILFLIIGLAGIFFLWQIFWN